MSISCLQIDPNPQPINMRPRCMTCWTMSPAWASSDLSSYNESRDLSSPGLLLSEKWCLVPPRDMEGDWSATERSGDRAHRNWMSVEATSFPVYKIKWTLSCSVVRKVTSPHQFLSSPSDLWLLLKRATNTSQSRISSCEVHFEI